MIIMELESEGNVSITELKSLLQVVAPNAKSKGYEPDFMIASNEV
ncbi:hypothetical protein [Paenibacillus alba]|uniref:Uncharacterized protein n=1 Tax=Paenibacillus alba TaxID=1197127 RepID=A0ABU6G0H6_9BACL|nr:hypothetical protein [Paenibacillus alba]MEC0227674.1 hypothetical protein [Paenibacillus alba]